MYKMLLTLDTIESFCRDKQIEYQFDEFSDGTVELLFAFRNGNKIRYYGNMRCCRGCTNKQLLANSVDDFLNKYELFLEAKKPQRNATVAYFKVTSLNRLAKNN